MLRRCQVFGHKMERGDGVFEPSGAVQWTTRCRRCGLLGIELDMMFIGVAMDGWDYPPGKLF